AAAGDGVRQRVGIAVRLRLRVGRDREGPLADREVRADERELVVAAERERPLLNRMRADVLTRRPREVAGESVAEGQAAAGDGVRERRIGLAVRLGLRVGLRGDG